MLSRILSVFALFEIVTQSTLTQTATLALERTIYTLTLARLAKYCSAFCSTMVSLGPYQNMAVLAPVGNASRRDLSIVMQREVQSRKFSFPSSGVSMNDASVVEAMCVLSRETDLPL
jgi:hypothetical protein